MLIEPIKVDERQKQAKWNPEKMCRGDKKKNIFSLKDFSEEQHSSNRVKGLVVVKNRFSIFP